MYFTPILPNKITPAKCSNRAYVVQPFFDYVFEYSTRARQFFKAAAAFLVLIALLMVPSESYAQFGGDASVSQDQVPTDIQPDDVIIWDSRSAVSYVDGYISVPLFLLTKQEFSIYKSHLTIYPPSGTEILEVKYPPTNKLLDPISKEIVDVFSGGDFEVILKKLPEVETPSDGSELTVGIQFLGCTSRICLFPYTKNLKIKTIHSDTTFLKAALEDFSSSEDKLEVPPSDAPDISSADDLQQYLADKLAGGKLPIYLLLVFTFVGGLLTNLTPCVYPMIPITLKVLSRQSSNPYFASSMYGLGILLTYTGLGIFAVLTGSLFGAIMASKGFNLALGLLMVVMAFSMLGFGSFAKLQQLGNRIGTGKASAKNAFLMGTGAGLVASPCTGPVLASLLAYSAVKGNYAEAVALLAVYSFGFAIPYIVLGGAASKITQIKLSPRWQVAVKILFAAVIMALGFFYLRIPLYSLTKELAPYWGDVARSFTTLGLIMFFVVLIGSEIQKVRFFLVGPMLFIGLGVFAVTQSLSTNVDVDVKWTYNETAALETAKSENRPVLIDAWAEWCVACKKMDVTTFKDPGVVGFLEEHKFVTLKLDLTETTDETEALQMKYSIQGLPTLILMPAGGDLSKKKVIAGYQSEIQLLEHLKKIMVK